jgi:hypothetical protein
LASSLMVLSQHLYRMI